MSRPLRVAEGGLIYHAMNRAVARVGIFDDEVDYGAFLGVLAEAAARHSTPVLAYCVMPDHFHLVVRPEGDGDLSRFMRWLTMTHTHRWHSQHGSTGSGHLYQGRFKSFPVQEDGHFLALCRHVESNALRAGLTAKAEDWRWGSLWKRVAATPDPGSGPALDSWPVRRPSNWAKLVNTPQSAAREEAIRRSIRRGQPFGAPDWQATTAARLGLGSTLRPIGRPRKEPPPLIGS